MDIITTNHFTITRNNDELSKFFSLGVWTFCQGENHQNWLNRRRAGLIELAKEQLKLKSMTFLDGQLYMLAAKQTDFSSLMINTDECNPYPENISFEEIDDKILSRLLVNSLAYSFGKEDNTSFVTNALYKVVSRDENKIVVLEAVISPNMTLAISTRILFKRSYLLEQLKNTKSREEEKKKVYSKTGYVVDKAGLLEYAQDDIKVENTYIFRQPINQITHDNQPYLPLYVKEKGEIDPSKYKNSRLYFFNQINEKLKTLYGSAISFAFRQYEVTKCGSSNYDNYTENVIQLAKNKTVSISFTEPTAEGPSLELQEKLKSFSEEHGLNLRIIYSGTSLKKDAWNIVVVPNKKLVPSQQSELKHDYPYPVQHLQLRSVKQCLSKSKRISKPRIGCLLKELYNKECLIKKRLPLNMGIGREIYLCMYLANEFTGTENQERYFHLHIDNSGHISHQNSTQLGFCGDIESSLEELLQKYDEETNEVTVNREALAIYLGGNRYLVEDIGEQVLPDNLPELLEVIKEKGYANIKMYIEAYLNPLIGIKQLGDKTGKRYYMVGENKHLAQTIRNAPHIREIKPIDTQTVSPDIADWLTSRLDFGLSRLGKPTVLPIEVKLLKEAARMEGFGPQETLF